jgi:hypothetical protein
MIHKGPSEKAQDLLDKDDETSQEEAHPSPPSHESLLHNISKLGNDEEQVPHVEDV